ncbi:hypothetical protein BT96DRAFT_304791 [Gymnopus androsaceus JB14]|uniref:DDE-1 domain-containing protein n=1 Tax=Gymnopus androsaceus JB14 TaxID=1447944 RepID=A0A6A4I5E1_9AGAR|nr:hypothetical protein BT96DRAFT_304791 [Gymnopus androsaceus JB14]
MVAILVHLILYKPCQAEHWNHTQLEMTASLLTRLPDHPTWNLMQIANIMDSPWPACLPILPLNMTPPQFDYEQWNKSGPHLNFTMIPIDYAECHKEIGLHCIWILSGNSYVQDVILYAKLQWIHHILNAHPSDKILRVLLDNVASLNKEDVRKALKWAEGAKEFQNEQVAQQLIIRIRRHLEPQLQVKGRSRSGRGADEHTSQNKVKPNWIVEKLTKSVEEPPSENEVKRRWTEKLRCF